jgi:isoleucyl-tRNA synthetase
MAGGERLEPGEYTLALVADDERPSAGLSGGTGVVVLDIDLTPELELEGRARDLVRMIQQARRDADLAVTDRIELHLAATDHWIDAAETHGDLLAEETLAVRIVTARTDADMPEITVHRVAR